MASGRKPVKDSVVVGIVGRLGRGWSHPSCHPPTRQCRHRAPLDVARPGRDLRAPGRAELGQDVLDVAARGLRRDPERLGDLGVGQAFADEPGDLELARRQRAPRLVVRGVAACHPQDGIGALDEDRRLEALGRRAAPRHDATASAKRLERTRHWAGRAAPRPPPTSGRGAPSRRPPSRGRSARHRSRRRPGRRGHVRDRARRRRRRRSDRGGRRTRRARPRPRPADRPQRRREPGHDERREQDPLVDRDRPASNASRQSAMAMPASPACNATSARPHRAAG